MLGDSYKPEKMRTEADRQTYEVYGVRHQKVKA